MRRRRQGAQAAHCWGRAGRVGPGQFVLEARLPSPPRVSRLAHPMARPPERRRWPSTWATAWRCSGTRTTGAPSSKRWAEAEGGPSPTCKPCSMLRSPGRLCLPSSCAYSTSGRALPRAGGARCGAPGVPQPARHAGGQPAQQRQRERRVSGRVEPMASHLVPTRGGVCASLVWMVDVTN